MKKAIIVLMLAGILGGGAWCGYYYWWRGRAAQPEAGKQQATTAKAEKGAIRLTVAATGRVVSNLDVDIKCKASGAIVKLPFDISDTVRKDELLVELDPVDEQRSVKLAEASVKASQARLEQAKQNLLIAEANLVTDKSKARSTVQSAEARAERARIKAERIQKTTEQHFTSQEDCDAAKAEAVEAAADLAVARVRLDELKTQETALELKRQDVRLAETEVESDQVSLDNARQRLTDTKVLAPMEGIVSARNVQVGQIISSAVTNVGGGTAVLTLSDLSKIFLLGSVDESDIGKVQIGMPVNVTADAYAGMKFEGKVVRIATKGVNVSNVVTFEVKIEVTSRNKRRLKPEMTANLEIVAADKDGVLTVPTDAVSRKQGKRNVDVIKADGTTETREVETGINDGTKVEIVSGLEEGETVAVQKGKAESRWRGDPSKSGAMNPARMMMGGGGPRR